MKKISIFCFLVLMLSAAAARAEIALPDSGVRVYDIRDLEKRGGNEFEFSPEIENVVQSRVRVFLFSENGKSYYVMEKDDKTPKGDRIIWNFRLDKEQLSLVGLTKKIISRTGRTVSETWYDYNDVMFSFPENLCYMYTIPVWLMGKELKAGDRYEFNILLSYNGAPMHMFANVKSVQKVTVPAGTYECYLIQLEPDLQKILGKWAWAAGVIAKFVPDYYFWLDVNPPHWMVRFEGKFGPVGGAPTQAYELRTVEN